MKPQDPLSAFPRLAPDNFRRTSEQTENYNCIAWAAADDTRWWWPDQLNTKYWPPGVVRQLSEAAFEAAYATLGYVRCENGDLERGFEKIAVYSINGEPTHAARQLPNGRWTSKLGKDIDIEHRVPGAIEGDLYGQVSFFMKRIRKSAPPSKVASTPAVPAESIRSLLRGAIDAGKRR